MEAENKQTTLEELGREGYAGKAFVVFEDYYSGWGGKRVNHHSTVRTLPAFTNLDDALRFADFKTVHHPVIDLDLWEGRCEVCVCVMGPKKTQNWRFDSLVAFWQTSEYGNEVKVHALARKEYSSRLLTELIGIADSADWFHVLDTFPKSTELYCVHAEVSSDGQKSKLVGPLFSASRFFKSLSKAEQYAVALSKADQLLWTQQSRSNPIDLATVKEYSVITEEFSRDDIKAVIRGHHREGKELVREVRTSDLRTHKWFRDTDILEAWSNAQREARLWEVTSELVLDDGEGLER